jgi:hypothetical protein
MPSSSRPQDMHIYYQDTIFDRLTDAGVTWQIYHQGIPQSIVMTRLLRRWITGRGYDEMSDFFAAAKGPAAQFPEYAFIEPCYFGSAENDEHPPADIRNGERLIADVYNAIRANDELWKSTLLIVTYDEHGGFYDHVFPPATVPPDAFTAEWSFDQLGARVPTILVSPWIKRGVIKTVFDHTSLLRYMYEKWNLRPLEARTQPGAGQSRANTFAAELKRLAAPRQDTPAKLQVPQLRAARAAAPTPPVEGSREALVMFVEQLPEPTTMAAGRAPMGRRPAKARAKIAAQKTDTARVNDAMDKLESLRSAQTVAPDPDTVPAGKKKRSRKAITSS